MKKAFTILLTLSLVFILTGCIKKPEEATENDPGAEIPQEQATNTNMEEAEEAGVVTSVIEALKSNRVLKCIYVDEDGDKSLTYIKGDKVYAESMESENNTIKGLVTQDKYYIWDTETNEGAFFNLDVSDEDAIKMNERNVKSSKDIINELEKSSESCEFAKVSDDYFELPDLEFVEWK